jgi:hypothetical protein
MVNLREEQSSPTTKLITFEGSVQEKTCNRLPPKVRDWVELRARAGYEKYGTYLAPNNGRDWLRDMAEELLDAVVYAECGASEGDKEAEGLLVELLPLMVKVSSLYLNRDES